MEEKGHSPGCGGNVRYEYPPQQPPAILCGHEGASDAVLPRVHRICGPSSLPEGVLSIGSLFSGTVFSESGNRPCELRIERSFLVVISVGMRHRRCPHSEQYLESGPTGVPHSEHATSRSTESPRIRMELYFMGIVYEMRRIQEGFSPEESFRKKGQAMHESTGSIQPFSLKSSMSF